MMVCKLTGSYRLEQHGTMPTFVKTVSAENRARLSVPRPSAKSAGKL